MDLGFFRLDFQALADFIAQPPLTVIWELFIIVGWTVFVYMFLYLGFLLLKEYKEKKVVHKWKWVLLAIDIPALNVQTPKAVEQMFAHLAGAVDSANIAGKYWQGHKQRWFSFEIISIDGYIQFLIRTEYLLVDLVEASVFAQYPEAEITEVEDYTEGIPDKFPNDTHDIWASDFTLTENDAFPIRTYREFEHAISKDTVLKDPMGTFLESFSRIGPGEQMWFQIIVEPLPNSWKEKSIEKIKEVIGDKSAHGHGGNKIFDATSKALLKSLETMGDQVFGREASAGGDAHDDHAEENKLRSMTPGQVKLVEAMEEKIRKVGFKTKMRAVYIARKEVFRPERGVQALKGAVQQFNVPSANSIAPTYGDSASYFFKKQRTSYRKNLLMKAYKKRKMTAGANAFVMNIEELATVWHFPMSHVKTPLLQKAIGKRVEPPAGLPLEVVLPLEPSDVEASKEEGGYTTDAGDLGYIDKEVRLG